MPLDESDKTLIGTIVAEALAAHQVTLLESVKKETSTQVNGALKGTREKVGKLPEEDRVAALVKERMDAAEAERVAAAGAKGKDPKDVELETLKNRLDAAERKAAKDAAERKDEHNRTLRTEERSAVQKALLTAGIIPELMTNTMAGLFERGAIARDKDGAIVFARKGEFGDEQLSLDDGIAAYLKTPEGMASLPPRNAGGSGDGKTPRLGAGTGTGKKSMTLAEAADILSNPTV